MEVEAVSLGQHEMLMKEVVLHFEVEELLADSAGWVLSAVVVEQ